jgi:hypothetical protein
MKSRRILLFVRIFALGAGDARRFLAEEDSISRDNFVNIGKRMGPTGQSKLIYRQRAG